MSHGFIELYDKLAVSTIKMDDFLTFYFSLAAHNDAAQLEEARDVMSRIFKPELRPYVKGKYDSTEQRDEFNKNGAGLLDGADIARERIKSGGVRRCCYQKVTVSVTEETL